MAARGQEGWGLERGFGTLIQCINFCGNIREEMENVDFLFSQKTEVVNSQRDVFRCRVVAHACR